MTLKPSLRWGLLGLLVLLLPLWALTTGAYSIGFQELSALDEHTKQILFELRLPRILLALTAGASLALSGALLQNCCKNPLADPYLFGIVSGAAFGVTVHQFFFSSLETGTSLFAFAGSSLAMLLVMLLSHSRQSQRLETLLLCGVAISFLFSALASALLYLSEPYAANRVIFWLLGSLSNASYQDLTLSVPLLFALMAFSVLMRRQLNALLLSDEAARSLGVPIQGLRFFFLVGCASLTAAIVASCGGIAFVGLMIPHVARRLFGYSSLALVFGSSLLGAAFLLLIDTLSRSLLTHQELPIGLLTSILGSAFFFVLLFTKRSSQ